MGEGASANDRPQAAAATGWPRITIAICTYRRPHRLAELLAAIAGQAAQAPPGAVEVVVVDNDPDQSARSTAQALGARYAVEGRSGVAHARNTALGLVPADADAIVFFDDDQLPEPGWLAALAAYYASDPGSVWSGPVQGEAFPDPPAWAPDYWPWRRPEPADGAPLQAAGAGNLLIPRRVLDLPGCRFRADLFPRVGEDTELTSRLVRDGVPVRFARGAGASEEVPSERRTQSWVLDRAASSGETNARLWLLRGQRRLLLRSLVVQVARSVVHRSTGVLTRRPDLTLRGRRDARVAGAYLRAWRARRTTTGVDP